MVTRFSVAVLLALLGALMLLPGTAGASDRGVWDAYAYGYPVAFGKASRAYDRAAKRVVRTKLRSWRAIRRALRASRRLDGVLHAIATDTRRAKPTSDAGRRGKALGLDALRWWRRSLAAERAGFRAWLHGHRSRALHRFRASVRMGNRSRRAARRAKKAFRAAGIDTRHPKVAVR